MADKNEKQIQAYAEEFIAKAELTDWKQEQHIAFVAYVAKRELDLDSTQVDGLMELARSVPALLCNASAFRQKLQGKEWGKLIPEGESKSTLENRYKNLI